LGESLEAQYTSVTAPARKGGVTTDNGIVAGVGQAKVNAKFRGT
jgi:hypothetical protein